MCYTRRKIQGGVGALRESDDTNFLKPNGQSRNLNVYGKDSSKSMIFALVNITVLRADNSSQYQLSSQTGTLPARHSPRPQTTIR